MRNSKGKSYILFDKLSSANPKTWSMLEVIFKFFLLLLFHVLMWELMLVFLQLGLGMSLALKWDELFWLGWFEFFCSADQIDTKWLLLIACRPFQISPALRSTIITMSNSSDFCWVAQEQWEGRIWLSILKVRSTFGFSFHWGFVFILLINLVRHSCRLNHMWL